MMPQAAFLYSIAGLSLTLAGFSGLVAAFRRAGQWKPIDSYRLRQIPEMGLATVILALATIPLADTTGSGVTAIQLVSAIALVFTLWHVVALFLRTRRQRIKLPAVGLAAAGAIDLAILAAAAACVALGALAAYEWLLVLLIARPMLAFVLVLTDVAVAEAPASEPIAAPSARRPRQ